LPILALANARDSATPVFPTASIYKTHKIFGGMEKNVEEMEFIGFCFGACLCPAVFRWTRKRATRKLGLD
jgi:hypothetical protein